MHAHTYHTMVINTCGYQSSYGQMMHWETLSFKC
jgi:hypothetical protein